jgi:DNA segregation ATPase FtsK/SpoIIIE-like protein
MVVLLQRGNSLFSKAARLVKARGSISISDVQREFAPGYQRAGEVVSMLHDAGIVGPYGADHRRPYLGGVVA